MNPSEIPDELVELLDDRAGKKHSREGTVVTTLAEILTRWEQIRPGPCCRDADESDGFAHAACPTMKRWFIEWRARATGAEAEVTHLRSLLRDVDLFGEGFEYTDSRTGEKRLLDSLDVTVWLRRDAVTEMEALRLVAEAAEHWRDTWYAAYEPGRSNVRSDAVDEIAARSVGRLAATVDTWRMRRGVGEG